MLFSMWLAASAAAVGVAWAGVSVVDDQVVDPPSVNELAVPTSTSAATPNTDGASANQSAASATVPGPNPTADQAEGAQEPSQTSPSTQLVPRGSTQTAPLGSTPTSTSTSQGVSPPTTVAAAPPAPTTSATVPATSSSTPTTTTPPAPAATTQTFSLTGGTAAISFSSSGVKVLWATPNPGFEVKIEPESPGVKVEFRADHHRSRVDAWWSGGPQSSLREEPRS